jgi:hypothetical protein
MLEASLTLDINFSHKIKKEECNWWCERHWLTLIKVQIEFEWRKKRRRNSNYLDFCFQLLEKICLFNKAKQKTLRTIFTKAQLLLCIRGISNSIFLFWNKFDEFLALLLTMNVYSIFGFGNYLDFMVKATRVWLMRSLRGEYWTLESDNAWEWNVGWVVECKKCKLVVKI